MFPAQTYPRQEVALDSTAGRSVGAEAAAAPVGAGGRPGQVKAGNRALQLLGRVSWSSGRGQGDPRRRALGKAGAEHGRGRRRTTGFSSHVLLH